MIQLPPAFTPAARQVVHQLDQRVATHVRAAEPGELTQLVGATRRVDATETALLENGDDGRVAELIAMHDDLTGGDQRRCGRVVTDDFELHARYAVARTRIVDGHRVALDHVLDRDAGQRWLALGGTTLAEQAKQPRPQPAQPRQASGRELFGPTVVAHRSSPSSIGTSQHGLRRLRPVTRRASTPRRARARLRSASRRRSTDRW